MNRRLVALSTLCVGLSSGAGVAHADALDGLGERLVTAYAAPASVRFAQAAGVMPARIAAVCAANAAADAVPALDTAFTQLVQTWAPVELLRFGPLVQANRFERIFFWPDPRGVVARQTQAALSARDAALLAPGALASGSVALQGMPALEFSLFAGEGALLAAPGQTGETSAAPEARAYRCALAQAVARQLADTAGDVAREWQPGGAFAQVMTQPGPDNTWYRTPREVAGEWLKAMSGGLQFQRDAKLLPALGSSPDTARALRAPLARSGRTPVAVAASLAAVGELFTAAQIGPALPAAQQGLLAGIPRQANALADRLRGLATPWAQAVTEPQARSELREVETGMRRLKSLIDEPVAAALGVTVGFNALDGD